MVYSQLCFMSSAQVHDAQVRSVHVQWCLIHLRSLDHRQPVVVFSQKGDKDKQKTKGSMLKRWEKKKERKAIFTRVFVVHHCQVTLLTYTQRRRQLMKCLSYFKRSSFLRYFYLRFWRNRFLFNVPFTYCTSSKPEPMKKLMHWGIEWRFAVFVQVEKVIWLFILLNNL